MFNAMGSIAIGLLITGVAAVLAIEMKGLLIGESGSESTSQAIRAALDQQPEIHRIVELRTQHLGPETLLVVAKVLFDPDLSSAATASTIDEIERLIIAVVPSVRYVYLEPD